MRMIAGDAREPVESEIVFRGRTFTVVSLQETDNVLVEIIPPAGPRLILFNEVPQRPRFFAEFRHIQIAGQDVEQSGNVRGTLNRRVAAQRHNASARPAHISQQELQNRRATNSLNAGGVLGPSDGITNGSRLFRARGFAIRLGGVEERFPGDPAVLFHHFGSVSRKMLLQKLEHAPRMLQGVILIVFIEVGGTIATLLLMAALLFRVLTGM